MKKSKIANEPTVPTFVQYEKLLKEVVQLLTHEQHTRYVALRKEILKK